MALPRPRLTRTSGSWTAQLFGPETDRLPADIQETSKFVTILGR